jgi:hypothetical protein
MGKGKAPKAPPPPAPPAEPVEARGQADIAKDTRKRQGGAKKSWITRGQTLGGGTNLKQG